MSKAVVETLVVGQLDTNSYLLYDSNTRKCFIIDPGDDAGFIINKIKDLDLKPEAVLATHGHFDHVLGATELKLAFKIPFFMNKKDAAILKRADTTAKYFLNFNTDPPAQVDRFLKNGESLKLAKHKLKVMETPGHTQGSICFYMKKQALVFVGDLLFAQASHGRTDLEGGDIKKLKQSIKKILSLPKDTIIYSGHGLSTKVLKERNYYQDLLK